MDTTTLQSSRNAAWLQTPDNTITGDMILGQRALTRQEQRTWLDVSQSRGRWHLVHFYSELAFATCMSTNEIGALRLGDIILEPGIINIPWAVSKNRYRNRSVAVGCDGDRAFRALQWLLNRARELGAIEPYHFLLPFRRSPAAFDPCKPMSVSELERLWEEVGVATQLKQFRPYDCRHTAITRYAEFNIPMATIMDMAGRMSPKMIEHYTHISGRNTTQVPENGETEQSGRSRGLSQRSL
jgi:integrase